MEEIRLAYITFSEKETAYDLGRTLINEGLVACVNLIDGMESMYRWKGQVESDQEIIMIAKTTQEYVRAMTQRVMELHPYECPCILTFSPNTDEGNPDYLQWLVEETGTE